MYFVAPEKIFRIWILLKVYGSKKYNQSKYSHSRRAQLWNRFSILMDLIGWTILAIFLLLYTLLAYLVKMGLNNHDFSVVFACSTSNKIWVCKSWQVQLYTLHQFQAIVQMKVCFRSTVTLGRSRPVRGTGPCAIAKAPQRSLYYMENSISLRLKGLVLLQWRSICWKEDWNRRIVTTVYDVAYNTW